MSLLLLVLPFVLIFPIILGRSGSSADWRQSFLSTAVIWAFLLLGITEILSAFDLLTRYGLIVAWATVGAGSTIVFLRRPVSLGFDGPCSSRAFCGAERMLSAGIGLIALTTFIIAVTAPPNTWDAMTYHMSRVMHWIQNQNVKHYPTHIGQQVFLPPLAEYVIMHFQILIGHDGLANMVQWGAMVGSAMGLSLIARELGARFPTQLFASFLGVTLPMGILQSTSTQNDYFAAFWLIALSYFLLRLQKEPNWGHAAMSGISLGLAWLTKPTSYLYAAPFLVVASWRVLRRSRIKGLSRLFLVAAMAIFLNLPHFARNINAFGHPFGPAAYNRFNRTEIVTPASVASNLVRNIALHVATPWQAINQIAETSVERIHRLIGLDVNDGRTTFLTTKFGIVFSNHEDSAGNLAHLILLSVCGFLLYALRRKAWVRLSSIHFACVAASFGLLCTFIRWNPWNSRYHLALFLLAAPVMAMVVEERFGNNKLKWLTLLLLLGSLPWVFYNFSRPLISYPSTWKGKPVIPQIFEGGQNIFTTARIDQYFANRWEIRDFYLAAADYLTAKGIKKIGIELGGDDWQYPFFPLLQERAQASIRIEHVLRVPGPDNRKGRSLEGFSPEAIVCLTPATEEGLQLGDTRYKETKTFGPVRIFLPDP